MRKAILLFILAAVIAPDLFSEEPENNLLESINAIRNAHHLGSLSTEPLLASAASVYAEECILQGFLSHKDSNGNYAVDRVRHMGGTAVKIAEVLGTGPGTDVVIGEWMKSPSHRSIILDDEWTHAGGSIVPTEHGIAVILLFQMRPFSNISLTKIPGGVLVRAAVEGFENYAPIIFSRGEIINPDKSIEMLGKNVQNSVVFTLSDDQVFYQILFGLKDGEEIIFTDRIFIP